jgi:hypothetical protein
MRSTTAFSSSAVQPVSLALKKWYFMVIECWFLHASAKRIKDRVFGSRWSTVIQRIPVLVHSKRYPCSPDLPDRTHRLRKSLSQNLSFSFPCSRIIHRILRIWESERWIIFQ